MFRDVLRFRRVIAEATAEKQLELLRQLYLLHLPAKVTMAMTAMILFARRH